MSGDEEIDGGRTDGQVSGDQVPDTGGLAAPALEESGPKWKVWLERIALVRPLYALYRGYSKRNGPLLSAGIAYYLLFSIAPMLMLTIKIVGHFVDPADAVRQLREGASQFLGPQLAALLGDLVAQYGGSAGRREFIVIGAVLLLWGATRLIVRLQVAFNIMWDVRVKQTKGFSSRRLVSRLMLYSLLLLPSVLLIVATAFNSGTEVLGEVSGLGIIADISQAVLAFLVTWGVMILVFTVLPDVRMRPQDCWQGALLTAVLCTVGTRLFGALIYWTDNPKYSGTVGSLIALIVWADFMAIITLLGVRLNKVLYHLSGKVVQPYDYSVIVDETQALGMPATELDPDEWARLYALAPEVVKKSINIPPKDGSVDSGPADPAGGGETTSAVASPPPDNPDET
jgi:membrane protein